MDGTHSYSSGNPSPGVWIDSLLVQTANRLSNSLKQTSMKTTSSHTHNFTTNSQMSRKMSEFIINSMLHYILIQWQNKMTFILQTARVKVLV